ncbi:MAG: hypothetical protein Tp1109DCM542121_59 [Prokaryotic dsDNA virus sp.]|nr:MAG: hypothetical protein Tp1109DCM542121_59 [Prokaryotic dsDNA virus sp.]|tara:strand:+ start:36726 stop:37658 length:933 start_codon:yes stop_codon:yes gene_type:complete
MPNIKGQHRKMFRKPGLARQAIGILASSPELAQEVQNSMPQPVQPQPVQNFSLGGLATLLGRAPAGYRETADGQYEPIPGFGGFYQRATGISDPAMAQSQRNLDLMQLGLRIAAGKSDDTATNVIEGLTQQLGQVGKRRQTNFANELAIAQLKDAKEKEKRNIELASVKRRTEVVKPMIKSLAAVGATVDPDSGQILYKGESYSDIGSFVAGLDKVDSERFEKSLVRETSGVDERLGTLVSSENIPFPEKMTRLGLKIDPENNSEQFAAEAIKAAQASGLQLRPNTSGIDAEFLDPETGALFNVYGVRVN